MKISSEKVNRYNQLLLAILGTGILIGVIFGLLAAIVALIISLLPGSRSQEHGIIADSVARDLVQQNLRKQLISYNPPHMIDSANNIYVIPVGKIDLKKAERSDKFSIGSTMYNSSNYEGGDASEEYVSGDFTNILVYSLNTHALLPVFDERIAINGYINRKIKDSALLLLQASNEDSNKDGLLNTEDLEKLYLYFIEEKKLKPIDIPHTTYLEHYVMNNDNDLIIRMGIDSNKNGEYDYEQEPNVLYTYSLTSQKIEPLVDNKLSEKLQQLLEGRKSK
jgi:hypothetical protein